MDVNGEEVLLMDLISSVTLVVVKFHKEFQ